MFNTVLFKEDKNWKQSKLPGTDDWANSYINKMKNYESIENKHNEEYLVTWENSNDIDMKNGTKTV